MRTRPQTETLAYHSESTHKKFVTLLKSSSTKTEELRHHELHITSFGGPMNWFKGKKFSNKNLSLLGGFVLIFALALSMSVSKLQKKSLSKKQNEQTYQVTKKTLKKLVKPATSKKYVAKVPVKKDSKKEVVKQMKVDAKKVTQYHFVKKSLKAKQRTIARVESVKLRANVDLSMDGWNNQHEQIETMTEKVGDDPVGAGSFEDKRMEEELAAAGI